ncbi:FG-GAP-like repeat-containing protein [Flavobacterium sp.]|uniref:FG-GAP-like repeat-containing protein n=1 Tax=Flavobacterium sp. TaxID=239 RepID=UPI003527424A
MKKKLLVFVVFTLPFLNFAQDGNTCNTAFPITTEGLFVVSGVNGTAPTLICAQNGALGGTPHGEWYVYTPDDDYTVTITSNIPQNNPKVDTRVHVYTGTCGSLACHAGDDDGGGAANGYSSVCNFDVVAGTTYYIAWDNRWSSNGFTFQLIENTYIPPIPAPVEYTTQNLAAINSSYNICVVDMDGDYKDDIVGINANSLKINYQTTPGNFTAATYTIAGTSKMPSWSMAAGDHNKDGYNDLILGSGSGLSVWSSNYNGSTLTYSNFSPSDYIFCQRTNFADLNNDGNLDVFSCHDIDANVYYLNDGSSNFTYYQCGNTPGAMNLGSITGNYATLFTDFDNDGDTDVFISKCSGPACELHRNNGDGTYTDISAVAQINITPIQTWSSAIADFDNDGDMDIIITASAGNHNYFRNNLDTTNTTEEAYTNITSGSGWDINADKNIDNIAYDFDNDGYVDVLGGGNKIMFNNDGNGTFSESVYSSGITVGAVGDLNNDGFLDIQNGSTIRYAIPNGNNWIKIGLDGVVSNKNGIGARVEIYGSWGKQIRDIRSGEGFKYMSTLNAHFGIGTATAIEEIKIIWPSGTIDVIENPSINQLLVVTEGNYPLNAATFAETSAIAVYPNPANNMLFISNLELFTPKSIKVYNTLGQEVINHKTLSNAINVTNLENGIYILSIETTDGKKITEQFIKN